MSGIVEYLQQIISARYGRDVRQAIHDGIQQCYYDGKAGGVDLEARQGIEALESSIDGAYTYTDTKIAELINGAPTTLDTLKEIADAMAENQSVVEALEASIGSKANADHTHAALNEGEYTAHMQADGNFVISDTSGNVIWNSQDSRFKGDVETLCVFEGDSETSINLSDRGTIWAKYSLIIAEIFAIDGNSVGSITFPTAAVMADGKYRFVYGQTNDVWGGVLVGERSIVCNRNSATTSKLNVYGVRNY